MPIKGTPAQAWAYSCKGETRLFGPYFFGAPSSVEQQVKLEAMVLRARDGATPLELFEMSPALYTRNLRHIDAALAAIRSPAAFRLDKEVILFYGPPGTGKTRCMVQTFPNHYRIPLGKDLWFDGYNGQEEILIDDFGQPTNLGLTQLLQLLDIYAVRVPIKGSFAHLNPAMVVITTNVHPAKWYNYDNRPDSFRALTRRFTSVLIFQEHGVITRIEDTPAKIAAFFKNPPLDPMQCLYSARDTTPLRADQHNYTFTVPEKHFTDDC